MKNKLQCLIRHLDPSPAIHSLSESVQRALADSAVGIDTRFLTLFQKTPMKLHKTLPRRKQHLRRASKKTSLCPATVAMSEAVALEEIGNFLDVLVPDTRYLGKKWSAVIDRDMVASQG